VALTQRARKDEDKQARREAILETAAALLGRRQFSTITMADVARRCGLAKGTLYLYFASKEALFLAALEVQLVRWFDHVSTCLIREGEIDAHDFAQLMSSSLADRETLTDLLTILHTVLERNIEPSTALAFKHMLRDKIRAAGQLLEQVLPRLPSGGGVRLLIRVHALVVGLRQMSDPAPEVAEILEREEFAVLRVEFQSELAQALEALVRGMEVA
jgi:AcrR family transcriptional regulator